MPGESFDPNEAQFVEPSADARVSGQRCWQAYMGMLAAGFSQEQALFLIGQILHGQAQGAAIGAALQPPE